MSRLVPAALLCLSFLACQDYNYEELDPSDFNTKHQLSVVTLSAEVDILFVLDNSGSMAGEQQQLAASFEIFSGKLDELFGQDKYHLAVVTTGVSSPGCPACDDLFLASCTNPTGESGAFQDRVGRIAAYDEDLDRTIFEFSHEPACRIIESSAEQSCFFDPAAQTGTVFVGVDGCGYERGLAPIRLALSGQLAGNSGFLRPEASLVIILVSDEEDCGEVGEVSEGTRAGGKVCYYAARGQGPAGTSFHPDDPNQRPYALSSVRETYDLLMELKGGRTGLVKFAAIVGVSDPEHPEDTQIQYADPTDPNSDILPACTTSACTGRNCQALPGTRYVELAEMFGLDQFGFVDTICQADFSATMAKIATWVACPTVFRLQAPIKDPALANILVNGMAVPRHSCARPDLPVLRCEGEADPSCPEGAACVETWSYQPGTGGAEDDFGTISFAAHFDPCRQRESGELRIDLVYVTE